MVLIPLRCLQKAVAEIHGGLPAQIGYALDIEGVAIVVSGAVGYVFDQALRLAHDLQDRVSNLLAACFATCADVVDPSSQRSLVENQVDRVAMVFDVDVVPHRSALAIQRERKGI